MTSKIGWWEAGEFPKTPRPNVIPKTIWAKMGDLQRYNLSKGLLVYDNKTKRCKRSRLSETTGAQIPRALEYIPGVSKPPGVSKSKKAKPVVVPKRLQKKKKKKVTKKKSRTHHRNIDPLVMVSGSGSFHFNDKSIYVGEIKKGVIQGNGTRTWKDGAVYTGGWLNGQRHGQGSMLYPTGEEYIGQWKNDTKTGRGTMFRKNGSLFIADWKDNFVLKPYTKKSSNEKAYDVYKMYLKLGTYQRVAVKLNIDKDEVKKLVAQHRQLKTPKKKRKPTLGNLFKHSDRKLFVNTSSIAKLNLKPKLVNLLRVYGIVTLKDMTKMTSEDLLKIPTFGNSSLKTVQTGLKEFGLRLKSPDLIDIRTLSLSQRRALKKVSRRKLIALDNYGKYMSERYG